MRIKQEVIDANRWIVDKKLVELTWGNVSAKSDNLVYIKPSGINVDEVSEQDVSVIDTDGNHLQGLKPSVDTPTHLALYRAFKNVGCVVHTHSKYSTIFAQASKDIPCLGTTHADYFYGDIPCVSHPNQKQIKDNYELNTGNLIIEHYLENNIKYSHMPACIVAGHGTFAWGKNINKALESAFVLELVAEMSYKTLLLNPRASLEKYVLDKHYFRKHGDDKYYGQWY